jgi:hypothetical protein
VHPAAEYANTDNQHGCSGKSDEEKHGVYKYNINIQHFNISLNLLLEAVATDGLAGAGGGAVEGLCVVEVMAGAGVELGFNDFGMPEMH